jgi:4-amino-4-deoxy-L-arabinose transferase-like glycosyltransferase
MNRPEAYGRFKGCFALRLAALRRRPWWELVGLVAIVALTAFMYIWALSRNGTGNAYYAAAVKSGALDWKASLFGSLDPGNFVTVDKTPGSFWVPELFVRVFGFSSWSILLPQALAGVASVLILYRLVRRWQGEVPALIAALVFALTPVVLAMFRFNNPDAFLTLLLLLATWAFWSALEKGSGWRLAGAGAWVGLAFLTKMLEALVVLPAFVLVYLVCAKPRFWRRLLHLLGGLAAMVVAGGWWVALVDLWPAASRPYIGGSTDNSVLALILSRTAGYTGGGTVAGIPGVGNGRGPDFAGSTGILRMFNEQLGGQIAWLLPLALLGLLAGLWATRKERRTGLKRAGYLLWGLWTVVTVLVFSLAKGVVHPYYAIVIGPGLAALVGAGIVALWTLGRHNRWLSWILPAAVLGSALWSAALLKRSSGFAPGLSTAVIVLGSVSAVAIVIALLKHWLPRWLRAASAVTAAVVTSVTLLAGPFSYDLYTVSHVVDGAFPRAGPASGISMFSMPSGTTGFGFNLQATAPAGLIAYLETNKGSAKYLVAVESALTSTPIILASDEPVMAMGGFMGGEPTPTLAQFKALVADGQVRYVLIGGFGGMSAIRQYVKQIGTALSPGEYGGGGGGVLYYLGN